MTTIQPIPSTYRRVTPALVVSGAAKALEFYTEVFGATERMRFPGPDGGIAHAEIEIGDAVLIVEDESPMFGTTAPPPAGLPGTPIFLFLYVADVDDTVRRAAELGATVVRPPQNQFYGDRDAHLTDPFGHTWTIATHVEDVAPEEMTRRMAELSGSPDSADHSG
ncbi:Predicted enzyme related to lactoylglutathione lyase [Nocardia otitidiscaviarum]|uniref:Predicted enzyme related to lactoylglutathione lyase n=1 Tax=Nocardia otitidiscaviarum TaxID=1823 RepID=A0A379JII2_9NOCA|nr:VOC family protein [Nocardia otitidiscaviarum]SUD47813.1 Predicted enzyme related to lactoylglutathione lyase [Nocardia otitidiscaviarum]